MKKGAFRNTLCLINWGTFRLSPNSVTELLSNGIAHG